MAIWAFGAPPNPESGLFVQPPSRLPRRNLPIEPEKVALVYNSNAARSALIPFINHYNTVRLDGRGALYPWDFGSSTATWNPVPGISGSARFQAMWENFAKPLAQFCMDRGITRIIIAAGVPHKISIPNTNDDGATMVTNYMTHTVAAFKRLLALGADELGAIPLTIPTLKYRVDFTGSFESLVTISVADSTFGPAHGPGEQPLPITWREKDVDNQIIGHNSYRDGTDPFPSNMMAAGYLGTREVETLDPTALTDLVNRAIACEQDIILNGYNPSKHPITPNMCSRLDDALQAWHVALGVKMLEAHGIPIGPHLTDSPHIYNPKPAVDPVDYFPIENAVAVVSGGQAARTPSSYPNVPTWAYLGPAIQNTPVGTVDWTGVYNFLPGSWGMDMTSNGERWSRYLYAGGGVCCFQSGSIEPLVPGRWFLPGILHQLLQGRNAMDAQFFCVYTGTSIEVTGDPLFTPFPRIDTVPEQSFGLRRTTNLGADERAKSFRIRSAY